MTQGTYVYPCNTTCPPGTPIATPQVFLPKLPDIWIDSIDLRIPAGHRGLTGIYIANNGTAIMPYASPPSFIVGDDDHYQFDVGVEVATQFQIVTYNLDVFAHQFLLKVSGRPMVTTQTGLQTATVVPIA